MEFGNNAIAYLELIENRKVDCIEYVQRSFLKEIGSVNSLSVVSILLILFR